jgi:DNA-binding Lrp family transcriptional regulator
MYWKVLELNAGLIEGLDEVDLKIINLLQEDSRLSFRKIAQKLGIASGTAYNRIKKMEDNGILINYTITLDPSKVGYDLTALILIEAEGKHLSDVENKIAKINNVVSVYDITGDFDIAVIARFKDRNSLNTFIKNLLKIPHINKTVTNVALNVIKEDFRIRSL